MSILTVGAPPSTYPTIAAANAAALPNDTIQLTSGYSNETATITQTGLTIIGDASSTGIVIQLAVGVPNLTLGGSAPIAVFDASDGNAIVGNAGDNTITVSGGVDAVDGGLGTDRLVVDYRLATGAVTGDSTTNFTEAGGGARSVTITNGTFENFTVLTGSAADTLTVGDGNNIINAGDGANTVTAGQGVNSITGGSGADTFTAGDGGNFMDGGDGANTLTSGNGNDTILSGTGPDTINTNGGSDTITVTGGADTVNAGSGSDRLIVDYSAMTTNVTGGPTGGDFGGGYTGVVSDTIGNAVNYQGVESFTVTTGSGNDSIVTGGGNDVISTGAGNDALTGGGGNDHLDGGSGIDTAAYSGAYTDYTMTYSAGTQTFTVLDTRAGSPDGTDTVTGVETFIFSAARYSIVTSGLDDGSTGTLRSDLAQALNGDTILFASSVAQVALTSPLASAANVTIDGAQGRGAVPNVVLTGSTTLALSGLDTIGGLTVGGSLVLQNSGTISETGAVTIGDGSGGLARIANLSGGTYNLVGDVGLGVGTNTASTFDNSGGTLAKTTGTGVGTVAASFQDSGAAAAQIQVQSGTLQFNGAINNIVAQTITGPGTFALGGGASTIGAGTQISTGGLSILNAGTSVTLAENLIYAGAFRQAAGTSLSLTGGYLLLSGNASFAGATVNGTQSLYAEGASTTIAGLTIGGTAVFENTGTTRQAAGTVTVGDTSANAAILFNYTGGIYAITDDSGIARGTSAASYILNNGLFEKTSGTGTSTIAASFVDTGSVAATGTLNFTGPANNFAGALSGSGTIQFSGGSSLLRAGTTATVSHLSESGSATSLIVGANLSYGGAFSQAAGSRLNLAGGYLLLRGNTSFAGAIVTGSQRLFAEGSTTIAGLTIGGTAVFEDTATVTQAGGNVTVGDTSANAAILFNYTGATYSITDNSGIGRGTSTASYLLNQGLLQKTGGAGTSTIGVNMVGGASAPGTVAVTSGTLDLGGTVAGKMNLNVGGGTTMILEKGVAAGTAAFFTGPSATLQLSDAQDYHGTIAGFAGGQTLDLRSIGFGAGITTSLGYTGNTSAGTLTVSDGSHTASLALAGNYTPPNFHLGTDSHGGSAITFV